VIPRDEALSVTEPFERMFQSCRVATMDWCLLSGVVPGGSALPGAVGERVEDALPCR
jgi:hypothetical protein